MHASILNGTLASISILASAGIALAQGTTSETGSGSKYRTVVTRQTEGELSEADFRQATLLASQVVMHLNDAVDHVVDEELEQANDELDKASRLVGVIRDLLPVTEVTTRVLDKDGKEVYRHEARDQDDQIPIYTGTIAVEVIEPVMEAKKEQAALAGMRLSDADLVYSSVLVDLGYLERKLRRGRTLLGEEDRSGALTQLVLAQSEGVRFVVDKRDDPLMEAQLALRLAQRMARDERMTAARNNLQIADMHLDIYRNLLAQGEQDEVRAIQQDLRVLVGREDGISAEEVQQLWQRVSSLFHVTAGQAQPTTDDAGTTAEAAAHGQ